MATMHQAPLPHHNLAEGGVAKAKQRNAAVGPVGKNRRALGDIGNLVTVRAPVAPECKLLLPPPPPPTSRNVTSFGSQLITNAQAAAAKNARDRETKPKIPVAKPNPEVIIEISPDTNEKSIRGPPSRKRVHTMTAVLTARSKVASGITDIDASDVGDQLAVVDYIEDIYKFYKISESMSLPCDYMVFQGEINEKMRAVLVDWLIEVHYKFELMPESLYLTFNIVDRYLSVKRVLRKELQLVGISAMLIACKYEEIWAPEVNDFICISDRAYSQQQILVMEKEILNVLEWSLTVPTPYVFLVRYLKAAMCDKEMEHMVFFFAELGLMQYPLIKCCPSMAAASAVYTARCTLKKSPPWTDTLQLHTGFAEAQLLECAKVLVRSHAAAPGDKLRFVYKKYSSVKFDAVALNPPATTAVLEELRGDLSSL